jgi:hypothetical protein
MGSLGGAKHDSAESIGVNDNRNGGGMFASRNSNVAFQLPLFRFELHPLVTSASRCTVALPLRELLA